MSIFKNGENLTDNLGNHFHVNISWNISNNPAVNLKVTQTRILSERSQENLEEESSLKES